MIVNSDSAAKVSLVNPTMFAVSLESGQISTCDDYTCGKGMRDSVCDDMCAGSC